MTENDCLYNSWSKMHTRCYDFKYHSYHRYGGRGIIVCDRWHTYLLFKLDMQSTWKPGLTLDRVNNDQSYTPVNCRWLPKGQNKKTLLIEPKVLLSEYTTGRYTQGQLALRYHTDQPHISRILKRARHGATSP